MVVFPYPKKHPSQGLKLKNGFISRLWQFDKLLCLDHYIKKHYKFQYQYLCILLIDNKKY